MTDVDQKRLYASTNAAVWAEEFKKVCPAVDEGLMIGWFANAIEVAKDTERRRIAEQVVGYPVTIDVDRLGSIEELELGEGGEEPERMVVLSRRQLHEFFGEVALPPWQDSRGNWIGGDIDCAVIASRLGEWVDQHDRRPFVRSLPIQGELHPGGG